MRRRYWEEIDFSVKDVIVELQVPSSPSAHNLVHYHEDRTDQHLLWLTRSVLRARKIALEEAERYLPVVEAAAKEFLDGLGPEDEPCGHRVFGECRACGEREERNGAGEVYKWIM
jgi:hypothetical protein